MMKKVIAIVAMLCMSIGAMLAQKPYVAGMKKVYDENADPQQQIDKAVAEAKTQGKFVICQVGGNWCPWCLKFADFITKDEEISKTVNDNYVYIHVNYPRRGGAQKPNMTVMKRLGNPQRFGFPVMVVLDADGKVIHIQDSSYLESGSGYDKEKVMSFFRNWTPKAVKSTHS